MKQLALITDPVSRGKARGKEHGGSLALLKRRSRRPLSTKATLHLVLRSELAVGRRSLLKNKNLVDRTLTRYARRFRIRIYRTAVCGNHIHCLLKGRTRTELQHFLRVVAGQIAQEILRLFPLQAQERKAFTGGTPGKQGHVKNQRTFWSDYAYTRVVGWGSDYRAVKAYVEKNVAEALGLIPYFRAKRAVPPPRRAVRRSFG